MAAAAGRAVAEVPQFLGGLALGLLVALAGVARTAAPASPWRKNSRAAGQKGADSERRRRTPRMRPPAVRFLRDAAEVRGGRAGAGAAMCARPARSSGRARASMCCRRVRTAASRMPSACARSWPSRASRPRCSASQVDADVWHRVRIGPFRELKKLNDTRAQPAQGGHRRDRRPYRRLVTPGYR